MFLLSVLIDRILPVLVFQAKVWYTIVAERFVGPHLLPGMCGKAVAKQWQSSGKAVAKQWQSSGKAVAKQWQSSGKAVAKQAYC